MPAPARSPQRQRHPARRASAFWTNQLRRVLLNAMWLIEAGHHAVCWSPAKIYLTWNHCSVGVGAGADCAALCQVASFPADALLGVSRRLAHGSRCWPVVFFILFTLVLRFLQATAPWHLAWRIAGSHCLLARQRRAGLFQTPRFVQGAAGSALALLIWAYYSAFIFLYGARFVYSVARLTIAPDSGAVVVQITTGDEPRFDV